MSVQNIKLFADYVLLDKVASGAFSEIYKVNKDGNFFALKKLLPHLKYDREYRTLFETEAKLLQSISDPAHFPLFYEKGVYEDEHFLILELIEGCNLENAIEVAYKNNIAISPEVASLIALEICKGLETLHHTSVLPEKPIVHGDLRASNVMMSKTGEVKMIDLGLKGGTFDYMPLERLHDRIITPYSDIYALGHILYEMLHGQRLLKAKTKLEAYFEMRETNIDENIFKESLPREIKQILVKILKQDSSSKYQNVAELKKDLESFLELHLPNQDIKQWIHPLLKLNP